MWFRHTGEPKFHAGDARDGSRVLHCNGRWSLTDETSGCVERSEHPPHAERCTLCWTRKPTGAALVNFLDDRLSWRFWLKALPEPNSGCWLWIGARSGRYGHFGTHREVRWSHRVAFEALVGAVPDGLELDHLCRNELCVNPAHLEPVTHAVNILRGDSRSACAARVTHCARGHEFTEENTWLRPFGDRFHRQCRTCKRENDAKYRAVARIEQGLAELELHTRFDLGGES